MNYSSLALQPLLTLSLATLWTDAHSVLSRAVVLHLFTHIFQSSSTSSIHLTLVLRSFYSPPDLPSSNASSTILTASPSHSNLHALTVVAIPDELNLLQMYLFIFILQYLFSYNGPYSFSRFSFTSHYDAFHFFRYGP